jgi:uncharacterized hydrophobic protein (TIGR00271 family)
MKLTLFDNICSRDKSSAVQELVFDSTPRQDFFLMIILAVAMATFGLLIDNMAVVIGSMLVAPILFPILSLSMGLVMADPKLISRSAYTLIKSIAFAVAASLIIAFLFPGNNPSADTLSKFSPHLIYAGVAFIAGLAAAFAISKPQLSELLPGVAISVALIPPIALMGIGMGRFNWGIISSSLIMLIINIAGIVFAGMLVFSLMRFQEKQKTADKAIELEEKQMAKEMKA